MEVKYVHACRANELLLQLEPGTVDLFAIDPPYYGIVKDTWDNQWSCEEVYVQWLGLLCALAGTRLKPHGSLVLFQGIGSHESQPVFGVVTELKKYLHYRNWITWKKRRAYGKSHDYLFCREEILWFSKSPERMQVTFNIPLTDVKRGYAGWDPAHPAKSEYKRVSNVWDDIPELMRPERTAQKPVELMDRIIKTHSNPGDLVVDFFAGLGTTGVSAVKNGRRFVGCEAIAEDAARANERVEQAGRERGWKSDEQR